MCIRTLTAEGYAVEAVENGVEGLEKLIQAEYDACFSDVTMPGLSGIQMYKALKEKYPRKADTMVFTTGDMLNPEVKAFVQSISRQFLAKPFLPEDLLAIIKRTIETRKAKERQITGEG
jgi:CheY-like chemotaxis protein